ncbi:hypothetical protein KC357_g9 [Hortaea werneckii]|nr:hypothetical protein KC357_g9 [Hortaea werneckii]
MQGHPISGLEIWECRTRTIYEICLQKCLSERAETILIALSRCDSLFRAERSFRRNIHRRAAVRCHVRGQRLMKTLLSACWRIPGPGPAQTGRTFLLSGDTSTS